MKSLQLSFGIVIIALLVTGASALSITISPDHIERGDQVTIGISDLTDNSTFSMQIEGTFAATPGGSFSFEMRNLVLPFALNDGSISATLRNTDTNMLIVKKGDTEVKKVGLSQGGVFSTSDSGDIPAGTYDMIALGGTAAPGASSIIASMTLQGKKTGPADSEIRFIVDGVTYGQVAITLSVDSHTVLSRTLQIGSPVTTTPTQAPGGGGGGGVSGGGISVAATAAATTPTTVQTTTVTTQTSPATPGTDTAPPTVIQTHGTLVQTTAHQPQSSPAPIGSPMPVCIVLLGIAIVLLSFALKRR